MKILLSVLHRQVRHAIDNFGRVQGETVGRLERWALMNAIDVVGQAHANRYGHFLRSEHNPTTTHPHVPLQTLLEVLTTRLAYSTDEEVPIALSALWDVLDVVDACERSGFGPFETTT